MAKARPCPLCSEYFNPKFGGKQVGNQIICNDCVVRQIVADKRNNTPN